jgi:RNA polymerase sigma-32 factor
MTGIPHSKISSKAVNSTPTGVAPADGTRAKPVRARRQSAKTAAPSRQLKKAAKTKFKSRTAAKASTPVNDTGRAFVRRAMGLPMLTPEREHDLALRWRDAKDEAAMHELVEAHIRLVVTVSLRFRGYGLAVPDLIQEGNVGLLQAAARFDPDRQVRFSTYATWWIRAAIQDYVLRNWSIVRGGTSASQKALFFNLRWLRAKIERRGELQLTDATRNGIAEALRVDRAAVDVMSQRLSARDQSLNDPIGEDGTGQIQDFLVDGAASPEDVVLDRHENIARWKSIQLAMRELNPREQQIVRQRLMQEDRGTLEEIGAELGITKERVRQIEHKALAKLKAAAGRLYSTAA